MSATLDDILIDQWIGNAPPPVKAVVEMLYKPGQSIAAARVLPNQSTGGEFESVTITTWANAHTFADYLRSKIGAIVPLNYRGTSYGNVLVQDVDVIDVTKLLHASGVHADATGYSYSPAGRVRARWRIVRLS